MFLWCLEVCNRLLRDEYRGGLISVPQLETRAIFVRWQCCKSASSICNFIPGQDLASVSAAYYGGARLQNFNYETNQVPCYSPVRLAFRTTN